MATADHRRTSAIVRDCLDVLCKTVSWGKVARDLLNDENRQRDVAGTEAGKHATAMLANCFSGLCRYLRDLRSEVAANGLTPFTGSAPVRVGQIVAANAHVAVIELCLSAFAWLARSHAGSTWRLHRRDDRQLLDPTVLATNGRDPLSWSPDDARYLSLRGVAAALSRVPVIDLAELKAMLDVELIEAERRAPGPAGTSSVAARPAARQARLDVDLAADPPHILLDGKPYRAPEAAVLFLAALIEADGYPVPFIQWRGEHPEFEGLVVTRVLDSLPDCILQFIDRGKGRPPRLNVEKLR